MKEWIITKIFRFAASHCLPYYHGKCSRVHGHTWILEVSILSNSLQLKGDGSHFSDEGMVMDFGEVKKIVNEEVIDKLDHSHLNDRFENPTCELILEWIWDRLSSSIWAGPHELKLWESPDSYCVYKRE